MMDPERLSHQSSDDFERALLHAARYDGPSPQGKKQTLLALGLGTALAGSASSTAVAAPSAAITLAKWMAVGALVGTGTIASVSSLTSTNPLTKLSVAPPAQSSGRIAAPHPSNPTARPSSELEPSTPKVTSELSAVPAVSPLSPRRNVTEETPPPVRKEPPATPAYQEPPTKAPPVDTAGGIEDPLAGELLVLDGARAALGRVDLPGAQAALQNYVERYPRGKLSTEAKILRIDLLLRQGN
ncbi:MAG: hypothetical protein RMJ98_11370 [Myxococcales bacterium]|nr:hypothetical protein [Polyangiaceae bacterium]MDW8249887.1 hypothetical protein [Myxococcales bacterium]